MYSNVDKLVTRLLGSSSAISVSDESTNSVVALLYYMAVLADGRVRDVELEAVRNLLSEQIGICEDELLVVEQSVMSSASALGTSLQPLEKLRELPRAQRLHIVENLKAISLADKEYHETEINLVARTIQLLLDE